MEIDATEKRLIAFAVIAILTLSILTIYAPHNANAPNGRRGVPSQIMNGMEFMAWPQTEHGFIKTVSGKYVQNTDMAFAVAPTNKNVEKYVILKSDPNRVAETVEISAGANAITVRWWETNPALKVSDPNYTFPFRTISTDNGLTWSEPQNIADLPDTPAVISVKG